MMPGMDGPATLAELLADPLTRDIPGPVSDGQDAIRRTHRLSQLGAAGILTKPFDPLKLAGEVATTLHWESAAEV